VAVKIGEQSVICKITIPVEYTANLKTSLALAEKFVRR
jgi:hypothetical protein